MSILRLSAASRSDLSCIETERITPKTLRICPVAAPALENLMASQGLNLNPSRLLVSLTRFETLAAKMLASFQPPATAALRALPVSAFPALCDVPAELLRNFLMLPGTLSLRLSILSLSSPQVSDASIFPISRPSA